MAKNRKQTEELQPLISSRLQKANVELERLNEARRLVLEDIKTLTRFSQMLKPKQSQPDSRAAPTLKHVEQGIRIAFQGKPRLAIEPLQQRVTQILKSQDGLSEQGLVLRVKQGIAKLKRDSEGFALAPPTSRQSGGPTV